MRTDLNVAIIGDHQFFESAKLTVAIDYFINGLVREGYAICQGKSLCLISVQNVVL